MRILIITGDHEDYAALKQLLLTKERFQVTWITSVEEAVISLSAEPVEAILLSIDLPDWSHAEILTAIRRDFSALPVIVLVNDEAEADAAAEAGAQDSLIRSQLTAPLLQKSVQYAHRCCQLEQHTRAQAVYPASERRYRRLLDNLHEGCQIIGFDWRYLYLNKIAALQIGEPIESLVGLTMMEKHPGIEQTPLFVSLRRCMEERIPQQIENLYVHPDGSKRWFELSIQPVPDGIFILSLDITASKLAEVELKALYNATSYLLEADSIITLGQQIVEAVVAEFEQADCGLILLDESEDDYEISEDDGDGSVRPTGPILRRVARTGHENIRPGVTLTLDGPGLVPLALRTGRVVYVADVTQNSVYVPNEVRTKSELVIPLKAHDRVIGALDLQSSRLDAFSEGDRRILSAYAERAAAALENMRLYEAINRHALELEWGVTERTAELQIAKEQTEAIFNNSLDCILLTDLNFEIERCNTRAYAMFNIDQKSLEDDGHDVSRPLSLLDLIAEADQDIVRTAARAIIDKDQSGVSLEIHACRHPDIWFDAELSISYIKGGGLVCALRDITERKQTHAALNAKLEEEQAFQNYQKELHQITIELTQIDQMDIFYRRAVELGRERLNLERLGLFLYNPHDDTVTGTFGTDTEGNLTDESHLTFTPWGEGIMRRALADAERFIFDEDAQLYTARQPVGTGWNAAAVLWNGPDTLGWLIADNGLYHRPASKPQLEILVLYASWLGTMIARKRVEVQLRESEALYRLLADNISDMVMRLSPDGTFEYVSASSRMVFGYEPEEMVGTNNFDYVHPEDRDHVTARVEEARVRSHESHVIRSRCRHKDGHYIWIESSGQAVFSKTTGEFEGFIAAARNITAQKLAEEALQESEARYRMLAENITDVIVRVTAEGVYTYASASSRTVLGYEPEEIIGETLVEHIHPDDLEPMLRVRDESVRTGIEVPLIYRIRHRDGHYIWLEVVRQPVPPAAPGMPYEYVASARDITDRKMAEEALVHQRDFLQLVIDNLPDLIMVRDQEGRFQLANRALAALYGVTPDALVGRLESEITSEPLQIAVGGESDAEVLDRRKPVFIPEETILDRYYQTTKIPLQNASQVYDRMLIVASDITARKLAEESLHQALKKEKELNELKSRFVSMASHEFRTPLATILMLTETLTMHRAKMTDAQIDQRLHKMQEQVDFLTQIMDDVLQLARLQARRAEFNPTLLDLDSLCRSVIDEFQSRPNLGREFVYTCDPVLHKAILDRKLIRQIVSNLISNAVKYSYEESKIIVNLEHADECVVLKVQDEGIGIPESDMKHLFEPFHRANNVGTISGTGLGLTIAMESVEMHGGTINVETEVGKGTTFIVCLPVTRSGEDHD